MKSFWRWTAGIALVSVLFVVIAAVVASYLLGEFSVGPDMVLTVDDERIHLGTLSSGAWLMALGGLLLAVLIVMVVLPLVLLLGVGVPLLLCAAGLALALLVVAAPFIALGLLVALAVRPSRTQRPAPDLPSRA